MAVIRLVAVVCEWAIPILLTAKYGVVAGIAAIALAFAFVIDIAAKDAIDKAKRYKKTSE